MLQAFQQSETFSANRVTFYLCSYSAGDGQDVLDAWHSLDWQRFSRCDITHFFFSDDRDLLDIIILLDQVRHGFFTAFFDLAASCYLVKVTEFGSPGSAAITISPVPAGNDDAQSGESVQSSCFELSQLEVASWSRADFEVSAVTDFLSTGVPSGLRERQPCTGPASPWSAREFTDLSDAVERTARCGVLMSFRWRGVSALSWVDKRQALSSDMYLGMALPQHTGQCVTIRGTSSGFLCMFHNTSVFARTFDERRFQVFFCPVARSTVLGPHP